MSKFSASCFVALLALGGQAMAADQLSYNRLDVGFNGAVYENDAEDEFAGAGFNLEGSWEFSPHVYGFAGISGTAFGHEDDDDEDEDAEYDFSVGRFELGVGFNANLSEKLDLLAGVSLQSYAEFYPDADDEDPDSYKAGGLGLNLGLRGLVGRRVSLEGGLKYSRVKFDEDSFDAKMDIVGFKTGVRVQINRLFGVGADLGVNVYNIDEYDAKASEVTLAVMFRLQFNDRDGSPQWQ